MYIVNVAKKKKSIAEENLKDLFINYLKEASNETYIQIGEDIKVNNKGNDFDYLLKSGNETIIALEITTVTKGSLGERPSKLPLFETFFKQLLNNGNELPSIIFTILEPETLIVEGKSVISDNKIKNILHKNSQKLKDEISREIQRLPLYEKHNINVATGIHFSVERGRGNNRLQFNPYLSHISIIDFDDDRYKYSEVCKVYEQLKEVIPKKNDSLDYPANKRVILVADNRKKLGTDKVLKYAMKKFIEEFSFQLTNVDEIFVCWNYEEQKVIFENVYP